MLAMLKTAVHARRTQYFTTDSAVDGENDIVLKTTLQLVVFHQLLSQLDRISDSFREACPQHGHPLEIGLFLLSFIGYGDRTLASISQLATH